MKVYIPVCYKFGDKNYKKTIQFVNPDASESDLADFVTKLNALTDNTLTGALRVVEDFINLGDDDISVDDVMAVINGTYVINPVAGGVNESDILSILDNSYINQPILGGITENDILNIWG